MSELYEMGWNDVIGNLKRAHACTKKQKREWAQQVVDGKIGLPKKAKNYLKGTVDAAKAFLNGKKTPFKGPKWVVEAMENA